MTIEQDILRPIDQDFRTFEKAFEQALVSDQPVLKDVLQYLLTKRGKQLRPQLVLLSAKLCRGITDKTIDTAVAMELLHTSSLVHDDVVDSSPLRRGHEAVHIRWTNKVAVLVGDFILARVIQLIAQVHNQRILSILANLGGALSSGELLQLHANATMWITEQQYYRVIEQKTACLFAACCEAGAESSGATQRQVTALRNFGRYLGLCFQLKDDVLDYSDSDDLGKPSMGDIRDGKATLPLLISLKRAPKAEADTIRELCEALYHNAPHIDVVEAEQEIKAFVMRYEGVRYAYQQMQRYKEKAVEELQLFHDSTVKISLLKLLDYAINRLQ